jgi:glycosyltransferase involved in cell wall biosynthesis
MRIAFIGQKGIPSIYGGVEKHAEELAVHLAAQGNQVTVYTRRNYTDKKLKSYKGVKLISLPTIPSKHLDAIVHTFLACLDTVRRDYDVIHFHSIGPSSLLWLVKLLNPGKLVVATFHTQCYRHQKWGRLAKMYLKIGEWVCCRMAHRVIVISKDLAFYTKDRYGIEPEYIPNGVTIPDNLTEARLIKEKWGLEKNGYILIVSRLIKHKGIHYAIKAFNRLTTDKKLVIVGDGYHTRQYVDSLKELAKDDGRIIFTGNQTGKALSEFLSNAYLFIQPSESEGLSIALLEAMAYERPVLASDIPENREALGEAGFTFQSGNVSDLQTKLEYLLADPSHVEGKGREAKARVQHYYDWEDIATSTEKLYSSLVHSKAAVPEDLK